MSDDTEGFDLVMPFVTVISAGGVHDDDAYVAGFEVGEISARLERRTIAATTLMVHGDNIAQLDLVAMRHGYVMDELDTYDESPGWVHVGFTRDDTTEPNP